MTKSESQMTHTTKSEYKRIGKPKGHKSNGKGETGYDSSEDSQPTEPSTSYISMLAEKRLLYYEAH
jgi:hypothetical protein